MRFFLYAALFLLSATFLGCGGSGDVVLPSTELTEEQKKQIQEDDARVADEESQGAKKR